MEWTFNYLGQDEIVFSKISGAIDFEGHKKWCGDAYAFASEHGSHRILIDFREMVLTLSILQIDDLPGVLKEAGFGPEDRIAALHDKAFINSNDSKFFENVAHLKLLQIKSFTEKQEAVAWLKSDSPPSET